MNAWDVSTALFFVAFMANGVRQAWRAEPRARWWQKVVNVKTRQWTWIDVALLAGFLISLVMSGGGDVLLRRA